MLIQLDLRLLLANVWSQDKEIYKMDLFHFSQTTRQHEIRVYCVH